MMCGLPHRKTLLMNHDRVIIDCLFFIMASIQNSFMHCRSNNTPRGAARKSAADGFSFRLEQRAEKRKEVCSDFLIHMFCLLFLFLY
jgi:hypothetical protein